MGVDYKALMKQELYYIRQAEKHLAEKQSLSSKLKRTDIIDEKMKIAKRMNAVDKYSKASLDKLNEVQSEMQEIQLAWHKEELQEAKSSQKNLSSKRYRTRSRNTNISNKVVKGRGIAKSMIEPKSTESKQNIESKPKISKSEEKNSLYATSKEKELKQEAIQTNILEKILDVLINGKPSIKRNNVEKKEDDILPFYKKFLNSFKRDKKTDDSSLIDSIFKKAVAVLTGGSVAALLAGTLRNFFMNDGTKNNIVPKQYGLGRSAVEDIPESDNLVNLAKAKSSHLTRSNIKQSKDRPNATISKKLYESKTWKNVEKTIKNYRAVITEGWADPNEEWIDAKGVKRKGRHMKGSGHYQGRKIDIRTTSFTGGQNPKKYEQLLSMIDSLLMDGATHILFEFDDRTPKDFLKLFDKRYDKTKEVTRERTKGTGEHLDVSFDKSFAVKQKDAVYTPSKATTLMGVPKSKKSDSFAFLDDIKKQSKGTYDKFKNFIQSGANIRGMGQHAFDPTFKMDKKGTGIAKKAFDPIFKFMNDNVFNESEKYTPSSTNFKNVKPATLQPSLYKDLSFMNKINDKFTPDRVDATKEDIKKMRKMKEERDKIDSSWGKGGMGTNLINNTSSPTTNNNNSTIINNNYSNFNSPIDGDITFSV